MGPGRLFWKLFFGNIILLAVVVFAGLWLIGSEVNRAQDHELSTSLKAQAEALREVLKDRFDAAHRAQLDGLVKRIARTQPHPTRITLVLSDGGVLADSEADAERMESHLGRKEIAEALRSGCGEDTRLSRTIGRPLRYVAVAVGGDGPAAGRPAGVVRVAMPLRNIGAEEGSMRRLIWGTGLLVLVASIMLALVLAQLWSRPIRRLTLAARSLSRGDLSAEVHVGGADELAAMGRSLNQMRVRLSEQLETIDRQRRTLESLLTQLHEGVVVAGPQGRIVLINPAAVQMLGLRTGSEESLTKPPGQVVEECIPRHELQQMLLAPVGEASAERGKDAAEMVREVRLPASSGGPEITILARASDIALPAFETGEEPTGAARPRRPGRLLVLTDVTQLTRVIQVKADFAANASHELRTPLSAIRAAIETLLKIDLAQETESARHFINMIDRHNRRLELLVADLLELSRLESPRAQFQPTEVALGEVLADIQEQHAGELTQKSLGWEVDLAAGLSRISANPHLLRMVLDNLIDNSIKFTEPRGRLRIFCREAEVTGGKPAVTISVSDTGCGIPPEEQTRVFERFYQVERARSGGALRGTGLGLSIVRHAVAAMKGSVELQSEPGKGTRVTITLPQEGQDAPPGPAGRVLS